MKRLKVYLPLSLLLLVAGCADANDANPWSLTDEAERDPAAAGSEEDPTEPGAVSADDDPVEPTRPPEPTEPPFVVHEWGTFTSVQGSDGEQLPGLHHEEESLPAFVYGRDPDREPSIKMMEELPEAVTQKLETPVVYFHNPKTETVTFDVDFPEGVISQWYPSAADFGPPIGELEGIRDGTMRWDLSFTDDVSKIIDVPKEDIWAPSRDVDAAAVRMGEEVEKFIFYRGLGRFEMPVRATSSSAEVTVTNEGDARIPNVIALKVRGDKGWVKTLGPLSPGESLSFSPTPKEMPLPEYVAAARSDVESALLATGLYADEARAMVDTWHRSYFETEGLRLLYIVPRPWTDALLPAMIEPTPDEFVRTLVGRIEVMTSHDEDRVLSRIKDAVERQETLDVSDLGRFAEPALHRVIKLSENPEVRDYCEEMISRMQ